MLSSIHLSEHVIAERVDDRWLLLNPRRREGHLLNPTGSMLWPHVQAGASPADLAEILVHHFHLPSDRAQEDVLAFLRTLAAAELVHLSSS